MEYKKSKWESRYEEFKNGGIDKDIEELNEKKKEVADKFVVAYNAGKKEDANKAQDEMNKLQGELNEKEKRKSSITANQAKIENILQLKKDLVKDSAELIKKQNEIDIYEKAKKTIEDNDKEVAKLEAEKQAIDAQIKQLNAKINNPAVKPEDRKKFEEDKAKLNAQRQQKSKDIGKYNNEEYSKALRDKDELEGKVGKYNIKSISTTLAKNEKLIAKCDLIGKNLVNGKSMEEINASLKKFKFTPNKDFAKKVSAMRDAYKKEGKTKAEDATKAHEEAESEFETTFNAAKDAKEKLEEAMKAAKKAEEEYNKINKLPVPKSKWYENIPGAKRVRDFVSNVLNKGNKGNSTKTAEEAKKEAEKAKAEAEKAKKEFEEAAKLAKEAQAKMKASKEQKEKATGERSTDYLAELRKQKGENTILEGMTLYGDTFRDRLKYQMPNVKTSLTQDEIDRAKSKNNYVMTNQPGKNDHGKDKRAYDVEARRKMMEKNIANMKQTNNEKKQKLEEFNSMKRDAQLESLKKKMDEGR